MSPERELIRLARSIGLIRYFHPSDAAAGADWNGLAVECAARILRGDPFREVYKRLLEPLTVREPAHGPSDQHVFWQHLGVDTGAEFWKNRWTEFRSVRAGRPSASQIPAHVIVQELRGDFFEKTVRASWKSRGLRAFVAGIDREGLVVPLLFDGPSTGSFEAKVPRPTLNLYMGFSISGDGGAPERFELSGAATALDPDLEEFRRTGRSAWALRSALYHWNSKEGRVEVRGPVGPGRILPVAPDVDERLSIEIAENETVELPLVLDPRSARRPYGAGAPESEAKGYADAEVRAADVILLWNVLAHFHPYRDVTGDLSPHLAPALERAMRDRDGSKHRETLQWLGEKIRDGHFSVKGGSAAPSHFPELELGIAGEELFVASGAASWSEAVGKKIASIDGRPAGRALDDARALVSGSLGFKSQIALFELLKGAPATSLRLELEGGAVVEGPRVNPFPYRPKLGEPVRDLGEGITYLDVSRVPYDGMIQALTKSGVRCVVFDLRRYPCDTVTILEHFVDRDPTAPDWLKLPWFIRPRAKGEIAQGFEESGWKLDPREPRLHFPFAVITGPFTVSAGESWVAVARAVRPGCQVGQTTAGANGDVNFLELPSGFRASWSGRRVTDHAGGVYFARGIEPDLRVEPSIDAAREGRDVFLEAARRHVRAQL